MTANTRPLRSAILQTLVYYDLLDYPLTLPELWQYLPTLAEGRTKKTHVTIPQLADFVANSADLEDKLICKGNIISFQSSAPLIEQRKKNSSINLKHWRKTRKFLKILSCVPFVRMIGINGSLALQKSNQQSDIDLFFIVEKNRIWTARAFTSLVTKLVDAYRSDDKTAGRFCLNHYITTDRLQLDRKNLYTARQYSQLVIGFCLAYFRKFQKANLWISDYLQHYPWYNFPPFEVVEDNLFRKTLRKLLEFPLKLKFGDRIEELLKKMQLRHIEKDDRRLSKEAQVVLTNSCLRFHLKAQEPVILEKYRKEIENFAI